MKVLVVEDEPIVAQPIADALLERNHEVLGPVTTVREAIQLVGEQRPALSLVDINLAGAPIGLAIAQVLAFEFDIPVIFTTGCPDEAWAHRHMAVGCISKPFRPSRLVDCIEALERRQRGESFHIPAELRLFG